MTTATAQENLIAWLRDAHAMEEQAEKMLQTQSARLEHYPQLKTKIDQHLEETIEQKDLISGCLERLGDSPSTLKDLGAKFMAFAQGMGGMTMDDEVVKGAMASYAFENIEIAMYTVLIEAAKVAHDPETREVCERILPQEVAMADWLKEHLPQISRHYLSRSKDPDQKAKV